MFVAVVPPAEVLGALDTFLEPRREADETLRWADPYQWHVTLAFFGAVPERRLEELVERLGRAAGRRGPMRLRLGGGGAFPSASRARVLWLGATDDPPGTLSSLVDGVRAAAGRSGVEVEGGRFRAHLTLARMRQPGGVARWLRVLDSFEPREWEVSTVELIQSHLGEGRNRRPRYETAAVLPLGGRGGFAEPETGDALPLTNDDGLAR